MATQNEYAQLASIVYQTTPRNTLPTPTSSGWQELLWEADDAVGFSAGAYRKGSEIVISYTGTNGEIWGAWDYVTANIPAALGLASPHKRGQCRIIF